jgi:16S rRNA (adenine1518-N6/adenine1519-N6)-dimethyltransferase
MADPELPPLREVIARHGLAARKSLGQNFILDMNLTRRIARCAAPLDGVTVVEVGPGPGGLTRALLLEGARRVVAVERDERCLPALEELGAHFPGRLSVMNADALAADLAAAAVPGPACIVANLPYNIATVLLTGWLEADQWPPWWRSMVLMFQKEVAQRIVAEPGTKAYGRLSVLAQWRTRCRIRMTLPPQAFTPPPKIDSAVVEFLPATPIGTPCTPAALTRVTAAAFGQRRKMLRRSLSAVFDNAPEILSELGIDPDLRAENLSVAQFTAIAARSVHP